MNPVTVKTKSWHTSYFIDSARKLAEQTGFTQDLCLSELEAEEGDYFAVLFRLRQSTTYVAV